MNTLHNTSNNQSTTKHSAFLNFKKLSTLTTAVLLLGAVGTSQSHGQSLFSVNTTQKAAHSNVKVICEPTTLLNKSSNAQTPIRKVQDLLGTTSSPFSKNNVGALTLSESSEVNTLKKENHLANLSVYELDKISQQVTEYSQEPKRKTLFSIMFGDHETTDSAYQQQQFQAIQQNLFSSQGSSNDGSTPQF